MKRILVLSVFLFGLLVLGGCTNSYTKVYLTADNYKDYISINTYYSDCILDFVQIDAELGIPKYNQTSIGHITTEKRKNCEFVNVSIVYDINFIINNAYDNINPSANLSLNGNSHCTFSCTYYNTFFIDFPYSSIDDISIREITGYVLIKGGL